MKYQKARSIIHQHRVAEEALGAAILKRQEHHAEFARLDTLPAQLRAELALMEKELEAVDQQRKTLAFLIEERRATLAQPIPGHELASQNLQWSVSQVDAAHRQVARWVRDLEEANRVVAEVAARDAERAAAEAAVTPEQRKAAEDAAQRLAHMEKHEGKYDAMGNKPDPRFIRHRVKSITKVTVTPNEPVDQGETVTAQP